MKNISIFILALSCVLFFAFKSKKESDNRLVLDHNNYIETIIENEGSSGAYIRTIKVHYSDLNTKMKINDSTYNRCSFESSVVFYSAFDTLQLNSISRKSCDINAFFNLNEKQYRWLQRNYIYYVKIINQTTKYQIIHDIPNKNNQRFLQIKTLHYQWQE
jgi:hypothetical protein